MKQPKPLPTGPPFLTIYTNTYLRPEALRRNMESVGRQTAVADIEQIVVPDHVGYGIAGALFGRVRWYAGAVRGLYVVFLTDDDRLASEDAVAKLKAFAERHHYPEVISVRVRKGELVFPRCDPYGEPVEGDVDLGTYVVRRDVWLAHVDDYGLRYQGDYDHALAMHRAGRQVVATDLLFAAGPQGGGRPELSL